MATWGSVGVRAVVLGVVAAIASAGCIDSVSIACPDGRVCPSMLVCDVTHHKCVTEKQLADCRGMPNGATCTLPDGSSAGCLDEVCLGVGCGNEVVEAGEVCDDGNQVSGDGCSSKCDSIEQCGNGFLDVIKGEACDCGDASVPDAQRPPGCSGPNSDAEGSVCLASCRIRGCGDGAVGGLEDCEGMNLVGKTCGDLGYYGGSLACSPLCRFDIAACSGACGDGTINGPSGVEVCDKTDLAGQDCTDFGFYGVAGLACNAVCGFDTAACVGRCGDGARNGPEPCDGVNLGGLDCTSFGYYTASGLACSAACGYDTLGCAGGFCGDGLVQAGAGEECDGTNLDGSTCQLEGFYGGTLACGPTCKFNLAACSGTCGDGVKNGTEQCDGSDYGGAGCATYGYYTGALTCDSSCASIGTTGCSQRCGDNTKNGAEACDNTDLGGLTCGNFGFYGGSLSCNGTCSSVVTTTCTGRCGDGVVNGSEECDATDFGGADCTDFGYYNTSMLACTSLCSFDDSACTGFCGDRASNGSEPCDGRRPPGESCVSWGYESGALGCRASCGLEFADCKRSGWVPMTNLSTREIFGLWAAGPNAAFAAADFRTVLRWDGSVWTSMTTSTGNNSYLGVWGSSANDVFFVGDLGVVAHWNGSVLSQMTSNTLDELRGVWGASAIDVFAVGAAGAIHRYNGTAWSPMTSGTTEDLLAVWGSSANNVIAVGTNGTILRYDGNNWQPMTSNTTAWLWSVWGSSASEMYAVGDGGTLVYSNGADWSPLITTTANLKAVWGAGPDDVFIGGSGGTLLHGSGFTFTPMASGTGLTINALAGGVWLPGGPADVFAAGAGAKILRYNATAWSAMTFPTNTNATNLWGSAIDNVFLVAHSVFRWDGTTWTDSQDGVTNTLLGLGGSSSTNVFATGTTGTIIHWTGAAWSTPMPTGTTKNLYDVWVGSTNDAYAVGDTGTVVRYNGATWSPVSAGTTQSLRGVWGNGPNDVFAVGFGGTIVRWNGSVWTTMSSGTVNALVDVWGSGPNDVYAVGSFGTLLHWNGVQWTQAPPPIPGNLRGVWGTGPSDVYFAGDSGAMVHWNGSSFSPMVTGAGVNLTPVWGAGPELFAAGQDGTVLHRVRSCQTSELACDDNRDDDCDGRIDCADADCASVASCQAGGACTGYATLNCNTSTPATTAGGTTQLDRNGCDTWLRTGREQTYRVVRASSGAVNVTLTGLTNDLDVLVIGQGSTGSCDPYSNCIAATANTGTDSESVGFTAQGNTPYFIAVDGFGTYGASYVLSVSCP